MHPYTFVFFGYIMANSAMINGDFVYIFWANPLAESSRGLRWIIERSLNAIPYLRYYQSVNSEDLFQTKGLSILGTNKEGALNWIPYLRH